ncbi:15995_t:CDS:2, partial [Entrophospora sp. SA101]
MIAINELKDIKTHGFKEVYASNSAIQKIHVSQESDEKIALENMTYTAEQLERQFRNLEDCQTLTGSFNKLESLREIKEELKKCTNKSEYDAKKGNYIRKCEESLRGLQEKSASSSMFAQKALLLQLIEDDGKKLKANVKKQQELSNKFNFDPNKRIDDLIESIKQAIENNRGSGSGGSGSGRNRNKKNDNDGDDEDDN